ncbi:MAG: A24 family peptidase [Candidatus Parvarchaeota archaeon]|nr:A24 family peptidase [Candidatus Jingweiarchaeum tengchongense]MCW1298355.1 A24 family peptidase [Candidatus Jingweiarchaeum tengchongense]MCW1300343.1 A24 family peptidase [Candidatus Jingweiarchaeum tengchongense]MCW1304860.1 A24 family peptidase [Candidatus Jingweiarchaeum tengchongense]MCW1305839.1 A24 family peptidase [Candidatus Jingweiarchaeum tengchongense]
MIETIMVTLGVIGTSIASIYDIKTREVPDSLSYFMLASAFILKIFQYLYFNNFKILMVAILSFTVISLFSYAMYKTGQWGGGDVKLLAGISILFASFSNEKFLFFVRFIFNLLLIGAIYGIFYMIILIIKNFKKIMGKISLRIKVLSVFILLATIFIFTSEIPFKLVYSFFLGIATIYPYIKVAEADCFEKVVDVKKLTEGDWLISDVKKGNKVIVRKKKTGLTKEDIKKLKEAGIRKIKIKEGIPFVPAILLTLIFTIYYENLILLPLFYVQ